ncbi:hydroxymethylbilane synthase [Glycocaulis sp.]|uniref:hydroxymethylbilane synthase n=1 Tax=Glycocaulis sp. TaxID=1969725 RepID=UPI003D1F48EA
MTRSLPVMALATRTSPLAMAQALMVQAQLAAAHGVEDIEAGFPILGLVTTGDQITDRALLDAGGKGLFTRELDRAQLDGEAAFAVHSMKDVPTHLPDGLELACVLEREDPSDILLTATGPGTLENLPEGALIGTASLRRQAQALHARPDLQITLLRGNVGTRLQKLKDGPIAATFLAKAGLKRLGRPEGDWPGVSFEHCLPAPAQGAIGITIRSDDEVARAALAPLNHAPTALAIAAERGVLEALDGSCRTPLAAYGAFSDGSLHLTAEVLKPDGSQRWRMNDTRTGIDTVEAARAFGLSLGEALRKDGGAAVEAILTGTGS